MTLALPTAATNLITLTVTAGSEQAFPASTSDTVTIATADASRGCAEYIPGSTRLLDAKGRTIAKLPDGIVDAGVDVGRVAVPLSEIHFVDFSVRVVAAGDDDCS